MIKETFKKIEGFSSNHDEFKEYIEKLAETNYIIGYSFNMSDDKYCLDNFKFTIEYTPKR